MGMRTTLYGYIEEMDFWKDPIKKNVRKYNSAVIKSLPTSDIWPPLSQEMFAICTNYKDNTGPDFEYSGRIIHFGANLKSVEYEWVEWKTKFEGLLANLFFLNSRVHFQTEYSLPETASWQIDLLKYPIKHNNLMPVKIESKHWVYESTYDQ